MKVRTNLTGGVIFIVFGAVLLLMLNKQVITYGDIHFLQSAKVLPFFAEIVMIGCGILLLIQSLVFKKETVVEFIWAEQRFALYVLGIFCVFAAAIYFMGFLIGSLIFVILMFILYKNRNLLQFILLCALAIGIYLLFTAVFYVQLPRIGGVK
jgi:hypothetical protein